MKFSQRAGITAVEKAIQLESVDVELRNSLWSVLTICYWNRFNRPKWRYTKRTDYISDSNLMGLFNALWLHHFKKPIDTIPKLYWDDGSQN